MLKAGLHAQMRFSPSVQDVMEAVRRIVDEDVGIFIYLTCCYVLFDPQAQQIEYLNAGNPPMLLYRAAERKILQLESSDAPPGLLPADNDGEFAAKTLPWQPGDILFIYSDGLSEAHNRAEHMYGVERVTNILLSSADREAQDILEAVLADLEGFLEGGRTKDDLTLVVARAC